MRGFCARRALKANPKFDEGPLCEVVLESEPSLTTQARVLRVDGESVGETQAARGEAETRIGSLCSPRIQSQSPHRDAPRLCRQSPGQCRGPDSSPGDAAAR